MSERIYHRKNGKWEARYVRGKLPNGKPHYGSVFADTREEAIAKRERVLGHNPENPYSPATLNILILEAGSYGREVKEELEKLHVFNEIAFLDDFAEADAIILTKAKIGVGTMIFAQANVVAAELGNF